MEPATESKTFRLELSGEDLSILRRVVDESLHIPQARAVERVSGRDEALQTLTGKPVVRDRQAPGNVVKRMNLGKKKRIRPCQWPSEPEDRARVKERTKERRAQNLPSPFASGRISRDGGAYLPSLKEQKTLTELKAKISARLALNPGELSVPKAVVSCVASDTEQSHRQTGMCVQISVNECDSKVEVQSMLEPSGGSMRLGDAFAFDASTRFRFPVGDWKGRLFFTARGDPL